MPIAKQLSTPKYSFLLVSSLRSYASPFCPLISTNHRMKQVPISKLYREVGSLFTTLTSLCAGSFCHLPKNTRIQGNLLLPGKLEIHSLWMAFLSASFAVVLYSLSYTLWLRLASPFLNCHLYLRLLWILLDWHWCPYFLGMDWYLFQSSASLRRIIKNLWIIAIGRLRQLKQNNRLFCRRLIPLRWLYKEMESGILIKFELFWVSSTKILNSKELLLRMNSHRNSVRKQPQTSIKFAKSEFCRNRPLKANWTNLLTNWRARLKAIMVITTDGRIFTIRFSSERQRYFQFWSSSPNWQPLPNFSPLPTYWPCLALVVFQD